MAEIFPALPSFNPSIHATPSEPQEHDLLSSDGREVAGSGARPSFTRDSTHTGQVEAFSPFPAAEPSPTPSLWNRLTAWMSPHAVKCKVPSVEETAESASKPISFIPSLEEPDHLPADWASAQFPPLKQGEKRSKTTMSPAQAREGLALIEEYTIEQIVGMIHLAQMELGKENAHREADTFSRYQKLKKSEAKRLEQCQELLEKDERVAGYCERAKFWSLVAVSLCGMAGAITSVNIPAEVLGETLKTVLSGLGAVGIPLTGVISGATSGVNSHFKRRFNEDKAEQLRFSQRNQDYDHRLDDSHGRLMKTAEDDNSMLERFINRSKQARKVRRQILQK